MDREVPTIGLGAALTTHAMDRLGHLNAKIAKRAGLRPMHNRVNERAVATLLRWDRDRLKRLLRDEAMWREDEVADFAKLLDLPEASVNELQRMRASQGGPRELSPKFDTALAQADGLYVLNTWAADLPLTPNGLAIRAVERPKVPDADALGRHLSDFSDANGSVVVATRIGDVDWHESPAQMSYEIDVAPSEYAYALATRAQVHADASLRSRLIGAAASADAREILSLAPFSLMAININLVTSDNKFMLARRSALVRTYKNEWNVGINEGMKVTGVGAHTEDFFDAARRGLSEELALHAHAVEKVVVNWFGYCVDCCNFYAFAHARTPLTSDDIERVRVRARDARELGRVDFLPLASEELGSPFRDALAQDAGGRWLHHARLSSQLLSASVDQLLT